MAVISITSGFREDGNLPGAGVISDAGWRSQVAEEEPPLAKLFVSILQRLGVETDSFAGYTGTAGTGLNGTERRLFSDSNLLPEDSRPIVRRWNFPRWRILIL